MPNWCYNGVELRHDDPTMIKKIVDAAKSNKGLFNTFIPYPENFAKLDKKAEAHFEKTGKWIKDGFNQGGYDWCLSNWGTKWDVRKDDIDVRTENENFVLLSFSTAWSPPIPFYEELKELGFKVRGCYEEGGMGFLGVYENGEEENYDFPYTIKEFNKLPKRIKNEFAHLKESIEENEEENEQ